MPIHINILKTLAAFVIIGMVPQNAQADKKVSQPVPRHVGTYGDWHVYTAMEMGHKICYMVSYPTSRQFVHTKDKNKKRGSTHMIIAHRPYQKKQGLNIMSIDFGYPFKAGDHVKVQVGNKKFSMFTDQETAWASPGMDDVMTKTALKGTKLVAWGKSARGTPTKDVYSLKGSATSYRKICELCQIRTHSVIPLKK